MVLYSTNYWIVKITSFGPTKQKTYERQDSICSGRHIWSSDG